MTLFELGEFKLANGGLTNWKVECDALTEGDWRGLALMTYEVVDPFDLVFGVPTGGYPYERAMRRYARTDRESDDQLDVLIVDDVFTTGGTITSFREHLESQYKNISVQGAVAFARSAPPEWIVPLWGLYPRVHY